MSDNNENVKCICKYGNEEVVCNDQPELEEDSDGTIADVEYNGKKYELVSVSYNGPEGGNEGNIEVIYQFDPKE